MEGFEYKIICKSCAIFQLLLDFVLNHTFMHILGILV